MRESCRRVNIRGLLCLACLLVCLPAWVVSAKAQTSIPRIACRPSLADARRAELASQLRAITGWAGLHFDGDGFLHFGAEGPSGGSESARMLLSTAQQSEKLIVIEDASGRDDVAFSRVLGGRWTGRSEGLPTAYIVQLDFTDFTHVMGDRAALAAFNAGWGALHEIEHAVNDSADAEGAGSAGVCEEVINRMRRECGLAERAEYFYTPMPGTGHGEFATRFVRLAFRQVRADNKQRQYWLYWDSALTGGTPGTEQISSR